jgi:TPP-dependent pyruvate/acetoin dehydrogenase alpha subunit
MTIENITHSTDATLTDDWDLSHRTITSMGRYRGVRLDGVDAETLLRLYRQALRLRRMEEALKQEYHPADEMRCPVHFCIGQEAVPAALSLLVRPEDYVFSHHRSHGYYFAKGSPLSELFAELYGKATGAAGGKAGSQDISHPATKFYSGAILAGAINIAAGAAFGLMLQGRPGVSVSGFGEAATEEGAFWEVMNFAGARKIPAIFLCENNRYSTYSDQLARQATDNIAERVGTFGVRARRLFGNDVVKVYRVLRDEMKRVRGGDGSVFIEAYTYRWNGHVGPEDDDWNNYRSPEERHFWEINCPVSLLEEKLVEANHLTPALKQQMESEIADEIAANFKFAKESAFPELPDWQRLNWADTTPMADKVLVTSQEAEFDHDQADARLFPY